MRWTPPPPKPKKEWNRFFCLLPRRCIDGTWVWLEYVERKWRCSATPPYTPVVATYRTFTNA